MSSTRQLGKLFVAELKLMFREKQVWFWNIFFPIILMVIFMLIFGSSSENFKAKVALVETSANATSDRLEQDLRNVPVFEWKSEQPVDQAQADKWIEDKAVDAVIVLPATDDAKTLQLIFNKETEFNATSQAISGIVGQFVEQVNWNEAGVKPTYDLDVRTISGGSEDLEYADFLMTGQIALAIAQGGLFGMVGMVEMRRKGLLKRLKMTPVRLGLLGLSGMIVRFILGVFQICVLTAIGAGFFGVNLHIDVATLIVAFFVGAVTFNALGYLFSSFSKTMEAYMGFANIASFLMMFLSGIFFPTSGFPDWLKTVSEVLPLTYFVEGMRDGMAYGSGIGSSDYWMGIAILAGWGAITYAIGALIYRRSKIEAR